MWRAGTAEPGSQELRLARAQDKVGDTELGFRCLWCLWLPDGDTTQAVAMGSGDHGQACGEA